MMESSITERFAEEKGWTHRFRVLFPFMYQGNIWEARPGIFVWEFFKREGDLTFSIATGIDLTLNDARNAMRDIATLWLNHGADKMPESLFGDDAKGNTTGLLAAVGKVVAPVEPNI